MSYVASIQYDGRPATLNEARFLYGDSVEQIDPGFFNIDPAGDELRELRSAGFIERSVGRYAISIDGGEESDDEF